MRVDFLRLAAVVSCIMGTGLMCGCNRSTGGASSAELPPVTVQVTHLKQGGITRSITLPSLNVRPYQEATLYAKVAGYLKTITVDKGDAVTEGQLLAEIEVPEMVADLAKYRAEAELAEIDYKRVREAQKKAPDLVIVQAVDQAKAKSDVA